MPPRSPAGHAPATASVADPAGSRENRSQEFLHPRIVTREAAKVLADLLGTPLIRLQCYEGLDAAAAIYEWDYPRQMLYLRTLEVSGGVDREQARHDLFGEEFLLKRPLLQATRRPRHRPMLLLRRRAPVSPQRGRRRPIPTLRRLPQATHRRRPWRSSPRGRPC